MTPVAAELSCVAALVAIAIAAVAAGGRLGGRTVYAMTLGVSLIALGVAPTTIFAKTTTFTFPLGLPWLGAHFRVDALAAFFLAVVNLGGAAASLYAIGYGRHEAEPQRVLPFFPAFLAGMNLVILADDAFSFLFAWELMSLASWALVMAHHDERDNARAGYIYIVMAAFGTFCLLLAFGLAAGPDGNYAFDAMRAHHFPSALSGIILVLTLFGAGSKAGLVPLHVWLPLAHPAAPSHVSALMSGVMTKVAVYGFIRIVFDLLGPPLGWWGIPILAIGGITTTLGILYALMQTDLKRVLAYSTIENIGLVFIGLGLALAFEAHHLPAIAALALTAALFHVLNHTFFKSLLFFGAGAVQTATGERDMEKLGGLIHRMPVTSALVLLACVAISALPPLNGFVSEWLTFQAILLSPQLQAWGLKLLVPAVGALMALAAALAGACFVRAYGISFLGRPRSEAAAKAQEVDRWSLTAMAILAVFCLILGILPGLVIDSMVPVVTALVGGRMPPQTGVAWLSIIPIAASRSSYNGLLVFVFIVASASLAAYSIHRLASRALRRSAAWDCGFPDASSVLQYTAGSFAQPIRRVFARTVFRARGHIDMPAPGDLRPARFTLDLHDPVWETIYAPISTYVFAAATHLNQFQFLTIRRYLSLVFSTLVLLLLVLALWP